MTQKEIDADELEKLIERQSAWSQKTFGSDQEYGPLGAIRHLKLEVAELEAMPSDAAEYADCFLLLLDAWRRSGRSWHDLIEAVVAKQKINQTRRYGKAIPGVPTEHIRE